jgi:hypothetical protein
VKIVNIIVNNIKSRAFNRSSDMMNVTQTLSLEDAESFDADVVKQYLHRTTDEYFAMFLDFIQLSNSYTMICNFYMAIWHDLQSNSEGQTMEALMVWTHASEIVESRNILGTRCSDIADGSAPGYRQTLYAKYSDCIKNGKTGEIRILHEKYEMRYFFAVYIQSLGYKEIKDNMLKIFDTVKALPFVEDMCFTAASVYNELIDLNYTKSIGTFEHFQTLFFVKEMMSRSDYATLDTFSKTKCESVFGTTPKIFQKILTANMSKCSILNRYYQYEALCGASFVNPENGYRNIYSGTLMPDDVHKLWYITMHSTGMYLTNYGNFRLRYVGGNVRGTGTTEQETDLQLESFHIRALDDDYILLEPSSIGM